MRDSVKITAQNGGKHFEIKRELTEVVSIENLNERLNALEGEEEVLNEQLERIQKNKKNIQEALAKGSAESSTDVNLEGGLM